MLSRFRLTFLQFASSIWFTLKFGLLYRNLSIFSTWCIIFSCSNSYPLWFSSRLTHFVRFSFSRPFCVFLHSPVCYFISFFLIALPPSTCVAAVLCTVRFPYFATADSAMSALSRLSLSHYTLWQPSNQIASESEHGSCSPPPCHSWLRDGHSARICRHPYRKGNRKNYSYPWTPWPEFSSDRATAVCLRC